MSAIANNRTDSGSQAGHGAGQGSAESPRIVLLVEEQAHVARVIRHNLERCEHQVESACDLDEALQQMASHCFDALVVSGELSLIDLKTLCARAARQLARHELRPGEPACPLMLISCPEDLDLAPSQPGFERLSHPVSLKQIVRRLQETFASDQAIQTA